MAGNDDGHHIRAVRPADGAARVRDAETFRHPGVGTRFGDWNGAQEFPGAHLEIGADRGERNIELKVLAGKIAGELGSNRIEIFVFARDNVCLQAPAQVRQLRFERAAIGEFEKP